MTNEDYNTLLKVSQRQAFKRKAYACNLCLEDLVQEAAIKILRNPWNPTKGTKKATYYHTVLYSVVIDAIRKQSRRNELDTINANKIRDNVHPDTNPDEEEDIWDE